VTARDGPKLPFTILTVFNAALSFRLKWEGNFQTLETQAQSSLENPANMATNVDEVLGKLNSEAQVMKRFSEAYGLVPDRTSLLDAITTYERSLLTPGSRSDRWLCGIQLCSRLKRRAAMRCSNRSPVFPATRV
jgi:cytochrome c peroxidase